MRSNVNEGAQVRIKKIVCFETIFLFQIFVHPFNNFPAISVCKRGLYPTVSLNILVPISTITAIGWECEKYLPISSQREETKNLRFNPSLTYKHLGWVDELQRNLQLRINRREKKVKRKHSLLNNRKIGSVCIFFLKENK